MAGGASELCAAVSAAASKASDRELGLDWMRKQAGVDLKIRDLKPKIIASGTACFGEAIFGDRWYLNPSDIDGEDDLKQRLQKSATACQDEAQQLIDSAKARSGWSLFSEDGPLLILQKGGGGDSPVCLFGQLELASAEESAKGTGITADDAYQFMRNVENRTLCDSMVRDGCVLRRFDKAVLFYQVYCGMLGFPGRDFVLVGGEKVLNEGKRIIVAAWTPDKDSVSTEALRSMGVPPKCSGYVRGSVIMTGYDVEQAKSGEVVLRLVSQVDLGSYVPRLIQRKVMGSMVQDMRQIKKWLVSHKSRKDKLPPAPEIIIKRDIFLSSEEILEYYQRRQK